MSLQLYVDLGMSGTKVSISDGSGFFPYLCPPRVADLPPTELEILKSQALFGGGLGSGAYLQIETMAYALGEDAQGRSNKTTATLRKSTLAHLRILGAIGELAYKFKRDVVEVHLGVALPFDEYLSDQEEICQMLSRTRQFGYRGKTIQVSFPTIKVLPEGAGLVQWRRMQAAKQRQPQDQTFVLVMVGYRDLTFLVFRQGKPPTGEPSGTVKLGYLEFLQSVSQGLCKPDDPYLFDALLRGESEVSFPDRPGKTFPLEKRYQEGLIFYWEQVRYHLNEKIAALDIPRYEVLVGGGTAQTLLKPHLNSYFAALSGASVNWLTALSTEVAKTFRLTDEASTFRFADCYGGAKWLALKLTQTVEA